MSTNIIPSELDMIGGSVEDLAEKEIHAPSKEDDMRTLLALYEEKGAALANAVKMREYAINARTDVVKKIAALIAPKKAFMYKGAKVTIVDRPHAKGNTVFFRGMSDDTLMKID